MFLERPGVIVDKQTYGKFYSAMLVKSKAEYMTVGAKVGPGLIMF